MNQADEPSHAIGELSLDGRRYWDGDVWGWQPLWLVPDEVIEAARQTFARMAISAHLLAGGLLNQSWRVDTDEGTYVLRVSRLERSVEQVAYEHAFVQALSGHTSVVVPPVPGRDGETIQWWRGRILTLFPFIAGIAGTAIHPEARNREAAAALAQIHRASLDHIRFGQRPGYRSVDEHPRWVWPTTRPILRRDLDGTEGFDDLVQTIDREIAGLDAWLDDLQASRRPLPRATVHGDFNPRNLIFDGSRLVAVIDWDDCRVAPIAWEVAQVALREPDLASQDVWRAYRDAGGPLPAQEIDLLGGFARMGALSELQWTIKDGRATPHAIHQLRGVADQLSDLRRRQ